MKIIKIGNLRLRLFNEYKIETVTVTGYNDETYFDNKFLKQFIHSGFHWTLIRTADSGS